MSFGKSAFAVGCAIWICAGSSLPAQASASDDCLKLSAFRQIDETVDACTIAIADAKDAKPGLTNYLTQLGKALSWANRSNEAVVAFDRALQLDKNNVAARIARAFEFRQTNQLEKAFSEFSDVYEVDPDNVEALTGIAMIYAQIGRLENALAAYNQVLETRPDHHYARFRLALLYNENFRNTQKSLTEFEKLLTYPDSELNKTETGEWRKEFNSKDLSDGIKYRRSQVLLDGSMNDKALVDLKWLIDKSPEEPAPYVMMATGLNELGRHKEALEQIDKAEVLCKILPNPQCEMATWQKVKAFTKSKRYTEAIEIGRKLAANGSQNRHVSIGYFWSGMALKRVGKLDEAKQFFQYAMNTDSIAHRAVLYQLQIAGFYSGKDTDQISEMVLNGLDACMLDNDCMRE